MSSKSSKLKFMAMIGHGKTEGRAAGPSKAVAKEMVTPPKKKSMFMKKGNK